MLVDTVEVSLDETLYEILGREGDSQAVGGLIDDCGLIDDD